MFRCAGGVFISLAVLLSPAAYAVERPTEAIRLWPGDAPGALGKDAKDTPTLTPFWAAPDNASRAVFIVAPGGGYRVLAPHEADAYAKWLAANGITAFVRLLATSSG